MAPKTKAHSTEAARKRSELSITQEEAARLLNVSKNTWIRWEKGISRPKELPMLLEFLWYRHREACPPPCNNARAQKIDGEFLAQHVASCKPCWLMVQFLAKSKKPKA
jgi:hypothetical protein